MKAVDLFAGCGGLSLGLQKSRIDVVAAFENWGDACRVYQANFKHPLHQCDLSDVEAAARLIRGYKPDIIAGGPPCQDFSSAGKRFDQGHRADLTTDFASIVRTVQPTWFLMENVERIQQAQVFEDAKNLFREAEYGLTQVVLNASLCGVPQRRKRLFLIGRKGAQDGFLEEQLLAGLTEKEMTVRDHFGNTLRTNYYYRHARSYARRGIYSLDEPSATVRGVNRPIPPNYAPHANDATHDLSLVRPLTTSERAGLQTFPKGFKWPLTSRTVLEQLIGNAVPVRLAQFVGQAILNYTAATPQALPKKSRSRVLVEHEAP